MKRNYLNFYGNLMRSSDHYLVNDARHARAQRGMLDNTLIIATSDHGEMGLAHGGMRQKNFNFYEETMRVPLVYSNPRLFKRPRPAGRSSPTSTSCRRWPAWSARRAAPAPIGRASITPTRS